MKPLKVYGTTLGKRLGEFPAEPRHHAQVRAIVAVRTKKEAAVAFGMSLYALNDWASETGNATEIAVATAKPGAVFIAPLDNRNGGFVERESAREGKR